MLTPDEPYDEASGLLVNQIRSDLWKPISSKYFQPATWENVVNDKVHYHSFRQFIQLMLSRLDRSEDDLEDEALALGRLIMNEDNWRFYNNVESLLPTLEAEYFANGKHRNLNVLYTYLKARTSQRDLDIFEGAEQKRFNIIKPIANSLDDAQMRELSKAMFGFGDAIHMNEQQKRLFKSYIEYAYPKDVVEFTKMANLIDPRTPATYGHGPGDLEIDQLVKGLPRSCVLSPARKAMRDQPLPRRVEEPWSRQMMINKHVSDTDPSQDEPPQDLLVELHRSKSALDVPKIQITEPTPEPSGTQRANSRKQTKIRPAFSRTSTIRSRKNQSLYGEGKKNHRKLHFESDHLQELSPINLAFAIESRGPDNINSHDNRSTVAYETGTADTDGSSIQDYQAIQCRSDSAEATSQSKVYPERNAIQSPTATSTKSTSGEHLTSVAETVKVLQPFGGYDGACDYSSLLNDAYSPEKKTGWTNRKGSSGRIASFTWKQRQSLSVPSPSDSEPLIPKVTITAVGGDMCRKTSLGTSFEQTLTLLSCEKEKVKCKVHTPGMALRAAEELRFSKLRGNDQENRRIETEGVTSIVSTRNVSPEEQKSNPPIQETEEDWFMPEVKTPGMVSWTAEDAKAAESAAVKQKSKAGAVTVKREDNELLKDSRSQIKTACQKNELESLNVICDPHASKCRKRPTTMKTILETNQPDNSHDLGKIVRYMLKRSSSSASVLSDSSSAILMTDEDLDLIKSPYGLTIEEDIRLSLERANVDFPPCPQLPSDGRPVQDVLRDLLPRLIGSDLVEEGRKNKPIAVLLAEKRAPSGPLHFEEPTLKVTEQDLDSTNVPYYMGRGRPGPGSAPPECQQIGFNPIPEAIEWFKGYCEQKREENRKQRAFIFERNMRKREEKRKDERREEYMRRFMQQSSLMSVADRRAALMKEVYGEEFTLDPGQEQKRGRKSGTKVNRWDKRSGIAVDVVASGDRLQEMIARHEKGKKKAVRFEEESGG